MDAKMLESSLWGPAKSKHLILEKLSTFWALFECRDYKQVEEGRDVFGAQAIVQRIRRLR